MKPDAETAALLRLMVEAEYPPIWSLPAAKAREIHDPLTVASAHETEAVERVEDREIATALRVRVYWPATGRHRAPLLLYFHGGGGAVGNLETHDAICRTLANASTAIVVSVDYRLGPEHKFPAAHEDAWTAYQWARQEALALGADPDRIAVGGDSAGGGLAAAVAQRALREDLPAPAFQLLIYPSLDASRDAARYPSVGENAEGYFLTRTLIDWFTEQYLAPMQDLGDLRLSPAANPDLAGLPPALIITAGLDPLRDEAGAYAESLSAAGVDIEYRCYEQTIHGFVSFGRFLSFTVPALREWGQHLREALAMRNECNSTAGESS